MTESSMPSHQPVHWISLTVTANNLLLPNIRRKRPHEGTHVSKHTPKGVQRGISENPACPGQASQSLVATHDRIFRESEWIIQVLVGRKYVDEVTDITDDHEGLQG